MDKDVKSPLRRVYAAVGHLTVTNDGCTNSGVLRSPASYIMRGKWGENLRITPGRDKVNNRLSATLFCYALYLLDAEDYRILARSLLRYILVKLCTVTNQHSKKISKSFS